MEQVELFYDNNIYRNVLAHQPMTSLLVSKDTHFPIGFRLYKKYKEDVPEFKTKIHLAKELVKEAYLRAINFYCVISIPGIFILK
jgi:hypothetical protein